MPRKQPVGVGMKSSKTELGKLLRECRLRLNWSQQEAAQHLGISQSYYSLFEIGNYPPLKWLKNLALVLQCDLPKLESLMPKETPIELETKTELGKLIRAQRKKLGLTIGDLAMRLGKTFSQINKLETSGLFISRHLAYKLEKVLKFPPFTLEKFTKTKTVNGTFEYFGRLIRESRYALGLNQTQLGKLLGVSKQFINQIELGRCSLSESDDTIIQLAEALNLDARKLFAIRPKRRLKQKKVDEPTIFLPDQIIKFRLEKKLTQRELAKRVGTNASSVCTTETRRYNPSPKLTRKFREVINWET